MHFINVEKEANAICIQLRRTRLNETELTQMMDELLQAAEAHAGSNVILSLGPDDPTFLYSVFLAKLVRLRKRVHAGGGQLKLAHASENVFGTFQACHLDHLFEFYPDRASALASF